MKPIIRSLHIADCLNEGVGGPSESVVHLVNQLNHSAPGHKICSMNYPNWGTPIKSSDIFLTQSGRLTRYLAGLSRPFYRSIRNQCLSEPQLIHNHGCWLGANYYARKASIEFNIPLLTSPRGMLDSWSLRFSKNKKRIARLLYEQKNLQHCSAFHATSHRELKSIRQAGLRQPVYIIPNGIHIPTEQELDSLHPETICNLPHNPFFLFLSRIHSKKGLDLLLASWERLKSSYPQMTCVIAGPDEDQQWSKLSLKFPWIETDPQIVHLDHVSGATKSWLLHQAEFLVLPTHSENFGIVVAESLAHSTPVLTTTETPWKEVVSKNCGWISHPQADSFYSYLKQALETSPMERNDMGARGRLWMIETFSWPKIATMMQQAYTHFLHAGAQPDFCITD